MRYITATSIFSGKEYLPKNTVLVLDEQNTITDIISADDLDKGKIEHHKGIITPGFINTHCHIELSHLKDKIERGTGIVEFGLQIIKTRNEIPVELQIEYMQQADKTMQEQGIVAVGDISNTAFSIQIKERSSLFYHTFVELIALNPQRAEVVFTAGKELLKQFEDCKLSASLAPHAPYTTSLELIKLISNDCAKINKPTSIHNQESIAENDFFKYKTGDYLKLYSTLNIPIDYHVATGKSSLQSVIESFNKEANTLLVHNTFTDQKDVAVAKKQHQNLFWCLCPNANLYIENSLPNGSLLEADQCVLTLGTDSLASNAGLSIIEEINCLLKHQSILNIETLLTAATYNGAQFLGLGNNFGLIEKNKKPGINLIEGKPGDYSVKKLG